MSRPGGLGRGLAALIPAGAPGRSGLLDVALTEVKSNPRQPRRAFDDQELAELAQSLRRLGMIQPIVVRPAAGHGYELIAGERRVRAARLAGLVSVPAVVRHTADSDLLAEALVENVQRADLNPVEEAAAYQQLLDDFSITHEDLAARLGKSRSAISNSLRLLTLPPAVQEYVLEQSLSAGHARALAGLSDAEQQLRVAKRVLAEQLSVRATEDLVRRLHAEPPEQALAVLAGQARARAASPHGGLQQRLTDALATRVEVRGSRRRGRVVIHFAGDEDLERLLEILGRGSGQNLLAE